ncbi:unnamed protein product [Microthlaspi erraticum]|uniref:Uncharacterized protein n=1 Tax=Microthlaspi erraticum TaxID=1685480 RepID=A0A6D2IFJ3_9BRAS|nr:unnamed protein product [Microthlaspi erraticum]
MGGNRCKHGDGLWLCFEFNMNYSQVIIGVFKISIYGRSGMCLRFSWSVRIQKSTMVLLLLGITKRIGITWFLGEHYGKVMRSPRGCVIHLILKACCIECMSVPVAIGSCHWTLIET